MKKLVSQYPGFCIGALFTYVCLVLNRTYIFPYFFTSFAPLVFQMAYKGTGGVEQDNTVNLYVFLCLGILFLMTALMYFTIFLKPWIIEKVTFSIPLFGFLVLQMFLMHPLVLYAITYSHWHHDNNVVPLLKTNQTFWVSSFAFIILGSMADVVRKRLIKRNAL